MRNLIFAALAALGLCAGCSTQSGVKVLEPQAFIHAAEGDKTAVIVDVRRPSEYAEGHLRGAVNVDWLDEAAFAAAMSQMDKAHTYYVYCRSGRRSHEAATKMRSAGLRVVDMQGGYLRWTAEGREVTK